MYSVCPAPFSSDEPRAFVLARFAPDDALAYVETLAFELAQRAGVPANEPHCSLLYLGGHIDGTSFRDDLARYAATLDVFELRTDKLLSVNIGSLWLTLEKSDALRNICSDLAGIARRCGLGNRGLELRDWVPHILLARLPDSRGLPLGTCVNLTLRVNRLDLTRQVGADVFETIARCSLDEKKVTAQPCEGFPGPSQG